LSALPHRAANTQMHLPVASPETGNVLPHVEMRAILLRLG